MQSMDLFPTQKPARQIYAEFQFFFVLASSPITINHTHIPRWINLYKSIECRVDPLGFEAFSKFSTMFDPIVSSDIFTRTNAALKCSRKYIRVKGYPFNQKMNWKLVQFVGDYWSQQKSEEKFVYSEISVPWRHEKLQKVLPFDKLAWRSGRPFLFTKFPSLR